MTNLQSLQIIWEALHSYREDCISEGDEQNDQAWDAICEAMAHLHETLEINQSEID